MSPAIISLLLTLCAHRREKRNHQAELVGTKTTIDFLEDFVTKANHPSILVRTLYLLPLTVPLTSIRTDNAITRLPEPIVNYGTATAQIIVPLWFRYRQYTSRYWPQLICPSNRIAANRTRSCCSLRTSANWNWNEFCEPEPPCTGTGMNHYDFLTFFEFLLNYRGRNIEVVDRSRLLCDAICLRCWCEGPLMSTTRYQLVYDCLRRGTTQGRSSMSKIDDWFEVGDHSCPLRDATCMFTVF